MGNLLHDLRYGARMLLKSMSFTRPVDRGERFVHVTAQGLSAALALVLTAAGIYNMIAHSITHSTR